MRSPILKFATPRPEDSSHIPEGVFEYRCEALEFRRRHGYWPLEVRPEAGGWLMREITLPDGTVGFGVGCQKHSFKVWAKRFGVGCQKHSFKVWAKRFAEIATRHRASRYDRELAWSLINLARVRAGMQPMRGKRA